MFTATSITSAITDCEQELRDELTGMYSKYHEKLVDIATTTMAGLTEAEPVSAEEFAEHVRGFAKQSFVSLEHLCEMLRVSDDVFVSWQKPREAVPEKVRNGVLIVLYQLYIEAMLSDSESEKMRAHTLVDVINNSIDDTE